MKKNTERPSSSEQLKDLNRYAAKKQVEDCIGCKLCQLFIGQRIPSFNF